MPLKVTVTEDWFKLITYNLNFAGLYCYKMFQYTSAVSYSSLGTLRSLRPLSPKSEQRIASVLHQLQQYYQYRGINLRTCCEDFDKHHIGVIQESQVSVSF